MKKTILYSFCLLGLSTFLIVGCSNSSNPVSPVSGSLAKVTMTAVYTSQSGSGLPKTSIVNAIDSIKLNRIRVVLRNIRLKTDDDSEVEMENDDTTHSEDSTNKLAPFVLDLDLNGSLQHISVSDIPLGTYDRLLFQIHKVSQSEIDSLSAAEQASFADFLNGDRYSFIIDGTFYQNGQATAFTYKSKINVELEVNLTPALVIDQQQTTFNLTLQVNSSSWFLDSNNALLDPTDPNNLNVIDNNLKSFLKAFKDNDKDGHEDND